MAFALCPDDGPPRLWRFVAAGEIGYANGGRPIVSLLLKDQNIQLLDKELLDSMPELDRLQVLHTHRELITI